MGTIGYTYGSEWHLLRYLGYHRDRLDEAIKNAIPGIRVIRWLDMDFRKDNAPPDPGCYSRIPESPGRRPRPRRLDREPTGIDFLPDEGFEKVRAAWAKYWPQTGTPPNWDAVAEVEIDGSSHWLLVEAKSHLREVISFCGAKGQSLDMISAALTTTIGCIGSDVQTIDWLGPYYQFCNRLAVLNFLDQQKILAKLLLIHFLGDVFPAGRQPLCPEAEEGWMPLLNAMDKHVGWTDADKNHLRDHVHKLFLPVCPPSPA
jgi:hypothetical protein